MKASLIAPIDSGMDPLEILRICGGYYSCPKDADGKRLGPLVGYAGKYGDSLQFVGDIYANFAAIEKFPPALRHVAVEISALISTTLKNVDVFCGAPIGGYSLADALGLACDRQVVKAEKKIIKLATSTSREKSKLVFGRHEIRPDDKVVIVEDVCNNFSTTWELISLIEAAGGMVVDIVCFLNRSLAVNSDFEGIPVIPLVRLPILQYEQGDPEVLADIQNGNVVWKPKDQWPKLMAAMANAA